MTVMEVAEKQQAQLVRVHQTMRRHLTDVNDLFADLPADVRGRVTEPLAKIHEALAELDRVHDANVHLAEALKAVAAAAV
jgi:hypothetical protein